jgi:hypothetical protein
MRVRSVTIVAAVLLVAGCVSVNKSVLSRSRVSQPVPRDDVQVYFKGDSVPTHERIAILSASGDDNMTNQSQLIDKMREEAGKLGANAIILNEVEEASTGAKVAQAILGTSAKRKGEAIAIYVPSLDKR